MSEHRAGARANEAESLDVADAHDSDTAAGRADGDAGERPATAGLSESDSRNASNGEPAADDLEAQHRDLSDRHLRLAAEFDNFRKRTAREWTQRVQSANSELLFELLSIADNFERALEVEHADGAYADGVRMIFQQLRSLMQRNGVEAIEAVGLPFDPHLHEALVHMPSDEYGEGQVCQEIRRGYRLHGRVLRPAQVAVSSGPAPASEDIATAE